jgi:hypothetical protein
VNHYDCDLGHDLKLGMPFKWSPAPLMPAISISSPPIFLAFHVIYLYLFAKIPVVRSTRQLLESSEINNPMNSAGNNIT